MRIGELADLNGVSVRALRYYEQQRLLTPERTSAGHRVYSVHHQTLVAQIQTLYGAGFCSTVIRELLPAFSEPCDGDDRLRAAFDAAEDRLESEKRSIEAELSALGHLREMRGLARDAHVRVHREEHDSSPAETVAFDHRDRRLR